ncbi:MAG: peptidylprolyl isomerase [Deltaproteobacteria bacterium]|nr:peptidylprolyl isomerase [Deltaproteobacteria bacterium]
MRDEIGPAAPSLGFVLACAVAACGGAAPPVASSGGAVSSSADGAAGKCLAIAGAKRERRPDEPAKVGAKHLVVKYAGSKRAGPDVTRTREEACLRAQEAYAKLEGGASFADVVKEYSEEPGAATREGSVGTFDRSGRMAVPFVDATMELKVGEVSHVVETDFGFHVIYRTE